MHRQGRSAIVILVITTLVIGGALIFSLRGDGVDDDANGVTNLEKRNHTACRVVTALREGRNEGVYVLTTCALTGVEGEHCSWDDGSRCAMERRGIHIYKCPCTGSGRLKLGPHLVPRLAEIVVSPKHELVLCSMIRSDDDVIVEWVRYHLGLGVSKIYFYMDEPSGRRRHRTRTLLERHFGMSKVAFVEAEPVAWQSLYRQFVASNHCMLSLRHTARWISFLDVDEFLLPGSRGESLLESIARLSGGDPRVGSLFVANVFFGAPTTPGIASVLRSHSMREENAHLGTYFSPGFGGKLVVVGKSIVRPIAFKHMHTTHSVDLILGFRAISLQASQLRINHYWCTIKRDSWYDKKQYWKSACLNEFFVKQDNEIIERQ